MARERDNDNGVATLIVSSLASHFLLGFCSLFCESVRMLNFYILTPTIETFEVPEKEQTDGYIL